MNDMPASAIHPCINIQDCESCLISKVGPRWFLASPSEAESAAGVIKGYAIRIGPRLVVAQDRNFKLPGESGFNPHSLFVPTEILNIVWMAVGSFYEVYDVDAGVCQRELNLTYKNEEKAKHRNVGVPKSRLDEMIDKLVHCGYKVAVVDQLSVKSKSSAAQLAVPRALSRLVTPATYTAATDNTDPLDPFSGDPNTVGLLLSITAHEIPMKPDARAASAGGPAPVAVGATLFSIRDLKMVSAGLIARPGWLQKLRSFLSSQGRISEVVLPDTARRLSHGSGPGHSSGAHNHHDGETAAAQQRLQPTVEQVLKAVQSVSPGFQRRNISHVLLPTEQSSSTPHRLPHTGRAGDIRSFGSLSNSASPANVRHRLVAAKAAAALGKAYLRIVGVDFNPEGKMSQPEPLRSPTDSRTTPSFSTTPVSTAAAVQSFHPTSKALASVRHGRAPGHAPGHAPVPQPLQAAPHTLVSRAADTPSSTAHEASQSPMHQYTPTQPYTAPDDAEPMLVEEAENIDDTARPDEITRLILQRVPARCMKLDACTVDNLELFANSFDGGSEGSLFRYLNRAWTVQGRITLRRWLLHPLQDPMLIRERQLAVHDLMMPENLPHLKDLCLRLYGMRTLDMTATMSRVKRAVWSLTRTTEASNPSSSSDGRSPNGSGQAAVEVMVTPHAIQQGLRAVAASLQALSSAGPFVEEGSIAALAASTSSRLLRALLTHSAELAMPVDKTEEAEGTGSRDSDSACYPLSSSVLQTRLGGLLSEDFLAAVQEAIKDGPSVTVLESMSVALQELHSDANPGGTHSSGHKPAHIRRPKDSDASLGRLEDSVASVAARLSREMFNGSRAVVAKTVGRSNKFVLEVPRSAIPAQFQPPAGWATAGQTKAVIRYSIPALVQLSEDLEDARASMHARFAEALVQILEAIDQFSALVTRAGDCIGAVDALCSMAAVATAEQSNGPICFPEFIAGQATEDGRSMEAAPTLDLVQCRHPCLKASSEIISNDIQIYSPTCILLVTGPNMGGKSTLLRQVAVLAILAHMGMPLPAQQAALSVVDRIFTRIGANDKIFAGQSTFFVELDETSTILREATSASLVILDELGRGTSTWDGAAIAEAVCRYITGSIRCRTMFATHYHHLPRNLCAPGTDTARSVQAYHMACLVHDPVPNASSDHRSGATSTEHATLAAHGSTGPAITLPHGHVSSTGSPPSSALQQQQSGEGSAAMDITFLYRFEPGIASGSFGVNVAHLAAVPPAVLRRAVTVSRIFEEACADDGNKAMARLRRGATHNAVEESHNYAAGGQQLSPLVLNRAKALMKLMRRLAGQCVANAHGQTGGQGPQASKRFLEQLLRAHAQFKSGLPKPP